MHISSCLHPQRIYNRFVKEFMYVPCGKCEACRNRKAFAWSKRLELEEHCWKYTAFVTLTYDDDHLPQMELMNDIYVDLSHSHSAPGSPSPCCNTLDIAQKIDQDELRRFINWKSNNPRICYLSVYDCQCFIKRLRKNSLNYCKQHYEQFSQKDYQIRYFLCGEYGSTTQRCHYHCLFFFSSEKQASYFEEVIRKSWKFGIVDFSYVSSSAAKYVASYVNSDSMLSPVYKYCKQIRPFQLCSKTPPIGTLFFDEEEVRQMFDSCSPSFGLPDFGKQIFVDVPLWKTFIYRLYPRLSLFDKFSDSDRIRLYECYQWFTDRFFSEDSAYFVNHCIKHWSEKSYGKDFPKLYSDYIDCLAENVKGDLVSLRRSILRWWYTSSRLCVQAYAWMMSNREYYFKIKKFYENVECEKLQKQYEFLADFSERYNGFPVGYYRDFYDSITNLDLADLSAGEILSLENMGIDIEKLFSDDLQVRLQYISELDPNNSIEFINFGIDNVCWSKKLVKSKKKNDYLQSNPELIKKVY